MTPRSSAVDFLQFDTQTLFDEQVYSDSYLNLPRTGKDTLCAPRFSLVAPKGKEFTDFLKTSFFFFEVRGKPNLFTILLKLRKNL